MVRHTFQGRYVGNCFVLGLLFAIKHRKRIKTLIIRLGWFQRRQGLHLLLETKRGNIVHFTRTRYFVRPVLLEAEFECFKPQYLHNAKYLRIALHA